MRAEQKVPALQFHIMYVSVNTVAAGRRARTRDAMASIGGGTMKPRGHRADATRSRHFPQSGQWKIRAGILSRRVLAINGDVRNAKIVIRGGVA